MADGSKIKDRGGSLGKRLLLVLEKLDAVSAVVFAFSESCCPAGPVVGEVKCLPGPVTAELHQIDLVRMSSQWILGGSLCV